MPVEREECCKMCGEDIPAIMARTSNFCSGFCAEEYEMHGGDEAVNKILNENMEQSMLGKDHEDPG